VLRRVSDQALFLDGRRGEAAEAAELLLELADGDPREA
jgi:cbb3-type cytochrome oxidase subunit 3